MSDREIMNAKNPPSAKQILKEEYPTIYNAYKEIVDEQFELFAKKHLDYGMGNVSAGTQLINQEEEEFAIIRSKSSTARETTTTHTLS